MVRRSQNLRKRGARIRAALSSAQERLWHRMSNTGFIPTFNSSSFKPSYRFIGARVLSCSFYYNLLHLPRQHIAATLQLPCPHQGRSSHCTWEWKWSQLQQIVKNGHQGHGELPPALWALSPSPSHDTMMYFPQNLTERLKTSSSYQRYVHAAIQNHILNLSWSVLGWKINFLCIISNNWFCPGPVV